MKLEDLRPQEGSRKARKRIGRGPGSGHGKTATKGNKGQRARAGSGKGAAFEGGQMPLARRIPKRGFKNPMRMIIETVNIDQLKRFSEGSVVDRELLLAAGLVTRKADGIKILGKGEIGYPLSLKVDRVSQGARQKIEAAGGKIIEVI